MLHGTRMVRVMDHHLDAEVLPYFWHGVGRASYFQPSSFVTRRHHLWPTVERARALAPHELARRNLCAGVAWAFFLVNMRHPEVMESFLVDQDEHFPDRALFIDGIVQAMVMRRDTSPDDPWVERFLAHRPDPSNERLCSAWERTITEPCHNAIAHVHPLLLRQAQLDQVFRLAPPTE
jgi:hypothetical protein